MKRYWIGFLSTVLLWISCGLNASDDEADDLDLVEEHEIYVPAAGEPEYWKALHLLDQLGEDAVKEGRQLLEQAAELEFTHAQNFLGGCYLEGSYGFKKKERKAVEYFRLAADRGNAYAQVNLGRSYWLGRGVTKNLKKARNWLESSIAEGADYSRPQPPDWLREVWMEQQEESLTLSMEQPPPDIASKMLAHLIVGVIDSGDKDYASAQRHFLQAAEAGPGGRFGLYGAAFNAGLNYAFGNGVERNLDRASELLERSNHLKLQEATSFVHSIDNVPYMDRFLRSDVIALIENYYAQEQVSLQSQIAEALGDEDSEDFDPFEAVKWYRLAADRGRSPWAMLNLAFLYHDGILGEPDFVRAAEWFRRAYVDGNHSLGTCNYAICLYRGIGVPEDREAAKELFQKYADSDIVAYLGSEGYVPRGVLTYSGKLTLLRKWAKDLKDAHAQYLYGMRYYQGWGVEQDLEDAAKWFRRAAKQGHARAQYRLGHAYQYAEGVDRNLDEAQKYYQEAFILGNGEAAFALGYLAGSLERGSPLNLTPDGPHSKIRDNQAIFFYEVALSKNASNAAALNNLGTIAEKRARRAKEEEDPVSYENLRDQMLEYYCQAIEQNSVYAHFNMGNLYHEGEMVEKDLRLAYREFLRAAEGEHQQGRIKVAGMLFDGEGVDQSVDEAMYHYRLIALDEGFAKQDRIEALNRLSDYYLKMADSRSDLEAAEFWILKCAEVGNFSAMTRYGDLLLDLERYEEARDLFDRLKSSTLLSAKVHAYRRLGEIYQKGLGVKIDEEKAQGYFEKSLKWENPKSFYEMGKKAYDAENFAEAREWWEKASRAGDFVADYQLGCLYHSGQGGPQDIDEAYRLFRRAAENDYLPALFGLALAAYQELPGAPTLEEGLEFAKRAEERGHENGAKIYRLIEKKLNRQKKEAPKVGTGLRDTA